MVSTDGTPGRHAPSRAEPGCWGSLAWCRQLRQTGRDCPSCNSIALPPTRLEYYP